MKQIYPALIRTKVPQWIKRELEERAEREGRRVSDVVRGVLAKELREEAGQQQ